MIEPSPPSPPSIYYHLSISFGGHGLNNPVPWHFIFDVIDTSKSPAPDQCHGLCVQSKFIRPKHEQNGPFDDAPHRWALKFSECEGKHDYRVDGWGRIPLLKWLPENEAKQIYNLLRCQYLTQTKEYCAENLQHQKWISKCLPWFLGDQFLLDLIEESIGKNIWDIEEIMQDDYRIRFHPGPLFTSWYEFDMHRPIVGMCSGEGGNKGMGQGIVLPTMGYGEDVEEWPISPPAEEEFDIEEYVAEDLMLTPPQSYFGVIIETRKNEHSAFNEREVQEEVASSSLLTPP